MAETCMKELSHYGPSLCVKFYKNYVVSGYGPFIQIYDYHDNGKLIHKSKMFRKNKIHGLSVSSEGKLLVFGSRSVSVVDLDDDLINNDENVDAIRFEKLNSEWIINGEFSANGKFIYLLTSYNKVLICDLIGNVVSEKVLPGERSILYSGSIKVLSNDKVLINAGTVMGGVLIWDLSTESKIHNLLGHEGSIFHVTVSDNGELVASCSDDRSIRIWDIKLGKELCIGWGHTARIWNLKFFSNGTKLVSVSEDSTCRIWDLRSNNNETFELRLSQVHEAHLIKNVWGVDIQEEENLAVTSGNDGRIKLIDIKDYGDPSNEISFSMDDISEKSVIKFNKEEIIKGFHQFKFGLIAITSLGKIIKFDFETEVWQLISVYDKFVSYSSTNAIVKHNIIIFSNNKCDLLLLKFSSDGHDITVKQELHLDELSKTNNCLVEEFNEESLLVCLESPNPRDKFICLQINNETLTIVEKYSFTKPENFVSSCLEVFQHYILVGSRFATIAIFDKRNVDKSAYIIKRLNHGDTTTNIAYVECNEHQSHLFSVTNRDGYYNFISINFPSDCNGSITYKVIHSNKIMKGFLEGAFFNDKGEYITYGFKSSLFYIYNETHCYEIASQVCGGAHRQWKLFPCDSDEEEETQFTLIYIKASRLHLKRINKLSVPETLESGLHGREIRDVTILKEKSYNDEYIFCTGSEDTTLKLGQFNTVTGKVTNHWTERKHVSGLQRCKFISEKLMISSSAREELLLWEINDEFQSGPYITIRQTLPTSSDNPDLRIMDFDTIFLTNGLDFIVSTVYSDSGVKIWYYDHAKNIFKLLIEGRYSTVCILNTSLEIFRNQVWLFIATTDGQLITYNITDYIPFAVSKEEKSRLVAQSVMNEEIIGLPLPIGTMVVHQSGIKTMNIFQDDNNLKIYTGGDDNAIGIIVFKYDQTKGTIEGNITSFEKNAGSSTITSCVVFNHGKNLLSTSVDQIVRIWTVEDDILRLSEQKYTTCADTGAADIVTDKNDSNKLLIGGVGLSIWES
ncbi:tRNA (34-2'-O)-methyltransferase regulator RTT10 NDAI_0F02240 [Naumovozyma dairenensis CBS 421]|uniref:Uncharacterized protein n=1 Tax=Naumovozyma dairenensis (strain ATCC 10597 / BCRC 20456 / CBS 421 / NBRC 0211 / NRRL Y-12639) TaxID=1071378 RepID=G0WCN1_NAUDC|nr:hypothetical protein NDAI_0F02240 [Naumovozyma dairenensis CBS 421]CCD25542.1 hypothetical protein NDAI_0F02240 [Naumovozyma dairenensis CBS 421]